MTDENPFAAMMAMGQEWAKQMEGMMPTMPADAMESFFGKGMNPEGLDAKSRLLMTLIRQWSSGNVMFLLNSLKHPASHRTLQKRWSRDVCVSITRKLFCLSKLLL